MMSAPREFYDEKARRELRKSIDDKLQSLKVYIPFIDYLDGLDSNKYEKMLRIKSWILLKKRYSVEVLNKFEEAIIVQYRNLLLEDVKIPANIYKIFNKNGSTKYEQINLCSDDEQLDDDDDDIIFSKVDTAPNEQYQTKLIDTTNKTAADDEVVNPSNINQNPVNSANSAQSTDDVCCITNNNGNIIADVGVKEEICNKNGSLKETRSTTIPRNEVINLCSDDELIDDDDNDVVTCNNTSLHEQKLNEDSLCLQDSSPSNIQPTVTSKLSPEIPITILHEISDTAANQAPVDSDTEGENKLFTRRTLTSRNSLVTEEHKDNNRIPKVNNLSEQDILVRKTSNEFPIETKCNLLTDKHLNHNLENLDYEELQMIYKQLSGNNSVALEELLSDLVNKETSFDNVSIPTTAYGSLNVNSFNEFHTPANNFVDLSACSNSTSENGQRFLLQNPQPHPYDMHPIPQQQPLTQSTGTNPYRRKLNLNDPRIVRHLKMMQNSPLFSALSPEIAERIAQNIPQESSKTSSQCHLINRTTDAQYNHTEVRISHEPSTYGEYRRQKAERAKEIERSKRVERTKLDGTQKKIELDIECRKKTLLSTKECNKPNDEIPQPENQAINNFDSNLQDSEIIVETAKSSENSAQPTKERRSRALKELECTVTGFNNIQDYLFKSTSGKRVSSENARSAIYKQLNTDVRFSDEKSSSRPTRSRRSSFSFEVKDSVPGIYLRISKRRKTYTETDVVESTPKKISKRRNTVTCIKQTQEPKSKKFKENDNDSTEPGIADLNSFKTQPVIRLNRIAAPTVKQNKILERTGNKMIEDSIGEKAKIDALHRKPYVRLQRLSQSEISKHTSKHKSPSQMLLNVELIEINRQVDSSEAPSVRTKSTTNMKKNIDGEMTERNTLYCALCRAKPHKIVNHYVRAHKTEAYVSRLTTSELEELQMNCPFAVACENSTKYEVQCIFCKENLVDEFINLYMHFSTHTGEYAFQCSQCKLLKPYSSDITRHTKQSKTCRNARVNAIYIYRPNAMVIHLHCCTYCNFVQLNEANIYKHLRDHHNKMDENPFYVQKYIIAAINDAEIVNELLPAEEDNEMDEENALIENELDEYIDEWKPDLFSAELCNVQRSTNLTEADKTLETNNQCMTIIHTPLNTTSAPSSSNKTVLQPFDPADLPRPIDIKVEDTDSTEQMASHLEKTHSQCHDLVDEQKRVSPHTARKYRHYPEDEKCLGLFKCMAIDCFFSSDKDSQILEHLNDHRTSDCPPIGYLQCSYCDFSSAQSKDPQVLITHVQEKHSYSRYQCRKCCYRSCLPENTLIHYEMVHGIDANEHLVYECLGSDLSVDEKRTEFTNLMLENVQRLKCFHCDETFSTERVSWEHLHNVHKIKTNGIIQEYTCIFCTTSTVAEKTMREHLALSHPDELAYTCRRTLEKRSETDFITDLTLCDINKPQETTKILSAIDTNSIQNSDMTEIVEVNEPKPSAIQLEEIAETILRSLLYKYTAHTGISPDRIYQCPHLNCGGFFSTFDLWARHVTLRHNSILTRCPHCHTQEEFEVTGFKDHLENHLQHMYVCFHCDNTFAKEIDAIKHFHSELGICRIETIKFNISYSYHIILTDESFQSRLEFLQKLRENVMQYLEEAEPKRIARMLTKWKVSVTDAWVDNFPAYSSFPTRLKKCLDPRCDYKTLDDDELYKHLEANHVVRNLIFKCSQCSFKITKCNDWKAIQEHLRMHNSDIYICCVCSYCHFDRQTLSEHIRNEHNLRDVPFLTLYRSIEGTYVGVSVIFACKKKTFSTKTACFLCPNSKFVMENYPKYLRDYHNVYLKYSCETCQAPFKKLTEVDEHFNTQHKGEEIKINCQFVSNNHISVCSVQPLEMRIGREVIEDSIDKLKNSDPLVSTKLSTATEIKVEILNDNESDSSVEIIEDDDIVCQEETRRNEQSASKANILKCIDLKNLC